MRTCSKCRKTARNYHASRPRTKKSPPVSPQTEALNDGSEVEIEASQYLVAQPARGLVKGKKRVRKAKKKRPLKVSAQPAKGPVEGTELVLFIPKTFEATLRASTQLDEEPMEGSELVFRS